MRRSVEVSEGEEARNDRNLPAVDNRERLRLKRRRYAQARCGAGDWNRTTDLRFTNSIEHRSIVPYDSLP